MSDSVKRRDLYDKVWAKLLSMTVGAAPNSIKPQVFAMVAVDVVLTELLRAGAIQPDYAVDQG